MAAIGRMSLYPRYCPSIYFPSPAGNFSLKYQAVQVLHRLDPAEVPKQAFLESDHKTVADFVPIDARLAMCSEARALIEALEPGLHQFFPVEIVRKHGKRPIYRTDGRVLDEPYYLFNVQAMLDAVCIERSEVKVVPRTDGRPSTVYPLPANYNIVLFRSAVDGHHVWRGHYQLFDYLFFSDTLVCQFKSKKLRQLDFHHLAEV